MIDKKTRCSKKQLQDDLMEMLRKAYFQHYILGPRDVFALGYLCAKYDLKKILNNQTAVINACKEYDKTDDLALADTIGETLIDLDVIDNSKGMI